MWTNLFVGYIMQVILSCVMVDICWDVGCDDGCVVRSMIVRCFGRWRTCGSVGWLVCWFVN